MNENLTRRNFLGTAGTATIAGTLAATVAHAAQEGRHGGPLKILRVADFALKMAS